ncbi:MAG: extracellular solute-binding protein [Alphaproteobacteria bacterium]|nr:extracellular solute-binding protein [Alphaproteobacteria bacterium]
MTRKPVSRTGLTRRHAGGMMFAAGLAPAILSTSVRAAINRGDTLTVGIWGGAQERITREHCAKPLEEKYGVKINYVLGGTPDRRSRAYAERGRPSFDIIYLNIFESRQAVADKVTQPPTAAVPNFANLYDVARIGGYGVAFNPVTVVYDKEVITTPMTSWKDFWRPDLKGKIAWPSYPGAQGTAALLMTARAFGGSEKDVDVAFRKIAELKPFAAIQSSQDQLYGMFDQKVAAASIEFGSFTRNYAETRNPRIVIANPVEGQAIAANFACITVGTKNQALAEAWIDLHLSPACQKAYAEQIYYSPTIRNANLPAGLNAKLIIGDAQVKTLVDFDWDHVIKMQPQWTQRFVREIAGA